MSQIPPTQAQPVGLAPHRGTLILVLGILSLIICAPLGIAAWIMGRGDLKRIDAGVMDPAGRGTTLAGMICGIISTILLILSVLLYVVLVVVLGIGAVAAGAAASQSGGLLF